MKFKGMINGNEVRFSIASGRRRRTLNRILADVADHPGKNSGWFAKRHYASQQHGHEAIRDLIARGEVDCLRIGSSKLIFPAGALSAVSILCLEDHDDCEEHYCLSLECARVTRKRANDGNSESTRAD